MRLQRNDQDKSFKRFFLLSCSVFSILTILFCFYFLYTIIDFKESRFVANRSDALDTTRAFAYSLAYNRLDTVKTYVSEDRWSFIDSWSSIHEAISPECKEWSDPPEMDSISGVVDKTYYSTYWVNLNCPKYFSYSFKVSVELNWSNNVWTITNWTDICETRGADEKCYK